MTNLTINGDIKLSKTNFSSMKDLYDYMIENQIITEVGFMRKEDLSDSSKELLEKSKKSSNLINI